MDLWSWLVLSVCPMTLAVLGLKMYSLNTRNSLSREAQLKARIAKELGHYATPEEVHLTYLRQEFLKVHPHLKPEDVVWIREQYELTGFSPQQRRFLDRTTSWPRDML